MAFDSGMFTGGLSGLFGGLFGNTNKPYDDEMKQYRDWVTKAQGTQQPYIDAGTGALGNYQSWLDSQKDPSKFINDQMGNYQESAHARNLQQQSMNAGQNAASASGLMGSTPLMQQLQQNAGNISSQDQNQWLQNVLGINTQYGQGQQNLINGGQNSANTLTGLYNDMGGRMGQASYNKGAAHEQNKWNTIGSGIGILGSFL